MKVRSVALKSRDEKNVTPHTTQKSLSKTNYDIKV